MIITMSEQTITRQEYGKLPFKVYLEEVSIFSRSNLNVVIEQIKFTRMC